MKNLVKTVPARYEFDLGYIKKGQIYKIEDTLNCDKTNYIVEKVTETELHITSLTRGLKVTLKPQDLNRFNFISKMKIVEDESDTSEDIKNVGQEIISNLTDKETTKNKNKKQFNTSNPKDYYRNTKELTKEECEKATENHQKEIKEIFKLLGLI